MSYSNNAMNEYVPVFHTILSWLLWIFIPFSFRSSDQTHVQKFLSSSSSSLLPFLCYFFLSSRTLPNTAAPDPGWFSLLLRSIVPSCMDLDCLMSMPFRLMAWAEAAAAPPLLLIPTFTCGHMNCRVVACFHITALAHITSDLARSLLPIRGSVLHSGGLISSTLFDILCN